MSLDDISIGSATLQPDRQLLKGGERIPLGPRALAILSLLARRRGEVVTKDEMFETIWPDTIVEENALQVHMTAVRKALGEDADMVETVRGIGYTLHEGEDARAVSEPGQGPSSPSVRRTPIIAALVVFLLAAGWIGHSVFRPNATQAETTLSVSPFMTSSNETAQEALAAGISAELISRLRRIEGLRIETVTDRASAKGPTLLGTIQTEANRVRLSARLEAKDGEVLWSESFDREINDLLAVQEEIARAASSALSVPLGFGSEHRQNGGTDNSAAYTNYIQGRINRHNPNRNVPTAYLQRALELDPQYIKAHTELTYAHGISLYHVRDQDEAERLKQAMDDVSGRALELGPDAWQSHAARGWYHVMRRDFIAADQAHAQVERLDPGTDYDLYYTLINFHSQLGRFEKVHALRSEMATIDPIFSSEPLPGDDLWAGEYAKVIAAFENPEPIFLPDRSPYDPIVLYWALRLDGQDDKASKIARSVIGSDPAAQFMVSMDYGGGLQDLPYDQLSRLMDDLVGAGGRDRLSFLALFASHMGNHRLALDYLRLAYNARDAIGGYQALWHPALARTRSTPEFAAWIVELGMDEAWRASGDWGDYCRPLGPDSITCK